MKMTMRKMMAVLATLAVLCGVLPLGSLFSAVAEDVVVLDATFDGGETDGIQSTSDISVEDGVLQFKVSKDWGNIYTGFETEANTDYTISFRAKSKLGKNFWVKLHKADWTGDIGEKTVAIGKDWNDYSVTLNSGDNTYVYMLVQYAGYAGEGEIAWFDNIKITKVGGSAPVEPDQPDVPADGNLFANGDFETGDNTGWDIWQSTTISADAAKDGAYGAHLVGDGGWGGLLNQTATVEAGKQYKLSFWIDVHASGVNVQVKDGAGKSIEGAGGWFDSNKKDTLVEWTFTATDNSVFLNFCGSGASPEDAYVDNFSLVALGETPVDNALVKNGGFETGDLTNWINLWDSCTVEFVEGCDSAHAIHITAGGWSQVRQNMIPVEPNTDYVLSADVKYAENFALMIKKGDDSGDVASVMLESSSDWSKATLNFNTGDLTAVCVLLIGWDGGGDAIIDNVVLAKKGEEPEQPDVPVVGGNLFANGDFETGDATGWETWQSTSISADAAKDGSFGAHLIGDGGWGGLLNQTMKVVPGQKYKLSFWLSVNKSGVNVQVKDGAGQAIEGAGGWFDVNNVDKIVEWTFTATDSTVLINFCGSGSAAEDAYVDNFVLEAVNAPAPSAGLVINGDFETGDATGWETWQSTTVTEEAAKNGAYGINLIGDGGWGGLLNQTIKVEAGETYTITMWVCVNTGGANLQIKEATLVEGEYDNTYLDSNELSGWTLRTFNVVANGDSIVLNFCGSGTNKAEDIYVDDIVVVKKGETPPVDDTYPIKNAGFETGDLTSWINLWNSCTYSFETDGYNKSKYALNFFAPGAWQQIRQDHIPVEPNTDYVVVGYVKNPMNVQIVIKDGNDTMNVAEYAIENDFSNKWVRAAVEFNSGDLTDICVLLISNENGNASAIFDDVQLYVKGTEPTDVINDAEVTEGPIQLDSFGVAINRPASDDVNLIQNGSFENAEGGQWQSVISDTLYVVDDATAPSGNKSLFFNTSGVTENNKVIFYLDVEPNTDYVFSAWVKGAFISDNNRFNATFGTTDWKDNFMVYSDHVFSNKNRQIVPTAWDNEWHLRSVQFNSGVNVKIGIGFAGAESQMWIDDIALYTVENGVKYADPRQIHYVIGSTLEKDEAGTCTDENNLIAGATMDGAAAQEFWSSAEGFKNGFISFPENKYEYGTSMKYAGDEDSCYTNAIKWLSVKPHTEYIFTLDMRVVVSGGGSLMLLDGKKRDCSAFLMVDFDQYIYDEKWVNISVKFDSGEFDRIGIAIVDGGGVALLDNMRLFESANRIETSAGSKVEYVKPPYAFGSAQDPHFVVGGGSNQPDSPDTGVSALGAVLAVALVPSSAFVAFKLHRKKEDEE